MILYALILGVALIYLFRREGNNLTLTGMAFGVLMLIYGFGHLYYYSIQDFDRAAQNVTTSLCWMWIMMIAGNELCRLCFPAAAAAQRRLLATWSTTPLQPGAHAEWLWRLLLIASTGLLAVALVMFGKLSAISQITTLTSAADIAEARRLAGGQGGYALQLFLATIAPFLAVMSLLVAKERPSFFNKMLAAALIILVLLFKLSTLQKSQWVWLLIEVGLGWYLIKRVKMRIGTGLLVGTLIFGAFMLAASITYPDIDLLAVVQFVLYRMFDICNEGLWQTYYVYPHYLEHTHGLNIGLLHSIYGHGELIPAHTQVARFFGSYDSTYNAMFLADAWVDFGMAGVIGVSLIIGFLLKAVDLFIASMGKTPVAVAMMAAGFFAVISLATVSAFTTLLTGGLALLPMFVVGMDAVGKRLARPLLRDRKAAVSGTAA